MRPWQSFQAGGQGAVVQSVHQEHGHRDRRCPPLGRAEHLRQVRRGQGKEARARGQTKKTPGKRPRMVISLNKV